MKHYLLTIIALLMMSGLCAYTQNSYELSEVLNKSKTYIARDSIILKSGFSFNSQGNKLFHAYIDEHKIVDADYISFSDPARTINTTYEVGTIEGEAMVNTTGAAVYTIPIEIMPGTQGVQPEIKVYYNSQMKNGLLGYGWNLNCVSAITRSKKTYYHDNDLPTSHYLLKKEGVFMLDGERLIQISGDYLSESSSYRTEIESFLTIEYKDSVSGFSVKNKDGWILEYGSTEDSRIMIHDNSDHYSWLLKKVMDPNGNYMIYTYDKNEEFAEFRLKQIEYTGNTNAGVEPYNKIEFIYDSRKDKRERFVYGKSIREFYLLKKIKCKAYNSTIREYNFEYIYDGMYSKLGEIIEYGQERQRYNSTIINWGDFNEDYARIGWEKKINLSENKELKHLFGDFNGDGITDFITYKEYPNNSSYSNQDSATVFISKLSGNTLSFEKHDKFPLEKQFNALIPGDFNGDGILDLVRLNDNHITYLKNYGSRFIDEFRMSQYNPYTVHVGDFDGKGIDKLLIASTCDSPGSCSTPLFNIETQQVESHHDIPRPSKSLCTEHTISFFGNTDMDGNGIQEFILDHNKDTGAGSGCSKGKITKWREMYELGGTSLLRKIYTNDDDAHFLSASFIGDFDGNGQTDFLYNDTDSTYIFYAYYNYSLRPNGIASFNSQYRKKAYCNSKLGIDSFPIISVADFNGDGASDILAWDGTGDKHRAIVVLNTDQGFISQEYPSSIKIPNEVIENNKGEFGVGDFDGDGRAELFFSNSKDEVWIQAYDDKSNLLVKSITNGINQKVIFNYEPITSSKNYTRTHPEYEQNVAAFNRPLYVVTKMTNEHEDVISVDNFYYKNASIHREGKGFLGFEEITQKNELKNISKTVKYSFLYNGNHNGIENPCYYNVFPIQENVKNFSETVNISETVYENSFFPTVPDVPLVIYPFVKSKTETNFLTGLSSKKEYFYKVSDDGNPYKIKETRGNLILECENTWIAKNNIYKNRLEKQTITRKGLEETYKETKTFEYDQQGRLTKEVNFSGHPMAVTISYSNRDFFGNSQTIKTETTGQPVLTSHTNYDNTGRFVISTENSMGEVTYTKYDLKTGVLLEETDASGLKTTYQYNGFQKIIKEVSPFDELSYAYKWDISETNLFKIELNSQSSGLKTTWYNSRGQETKVQVPGFSGNVVTEKTYNDKGQLYRSYFPGYNIKSTEYVEYQYDSYGRITAENDRGNLTKYFYTGLQTLIVTPDNKGYTQKLNSSGLLDHETDVDGKKVEYTYNSLEMPVRIISKDLTTYIGYDDRGFQKSLKDPNMSDTVRYSYNAYGELESITNARKQTITMSYDALGRIIKKVFPEKTFTYQYVSSGNGKGQLSSVKEGTNIVQSYKYNEKGLPLSITEKLDNVDYTTSYEYDSFGRVIKEKSPSGLSIDLHYTNGCLSSIKNADNNALIWQTNSANALGQITTSTYGNGLKRISEYDEYNSFKKISLMNGTSYLDEIEYDFNRVTGNLNQRYDITGKRKEIFEYDDLKRLRTITLNNGNPFSITYKANGNIKTKEDVGSYNYEKENHALSEITNPSATYQPKLLDINYTSYNRASSITDAGSVTKKLDIEYGYDTQRRKSKYYEESVLKKTMYYIGNYEKEVTAEGVIKEYDYIQTPEGLSAISVKSNNIRSFYYVHTDHLGNIRVVTTANKDIKTRYYYDAWGKQTVSSGTKITNRGFLSQEHLDEFGLINLNARMYDPVVGRFLGLDPYVQMTGNTQSYNRYSYAMNNPLRYKDPSGEIIPYVVAGMILLTKFYNDAYKANDNELNPTKWDWSKANYTIGFSSENGIYGGVGWNGAFSILTGSGFGSYFPVAGYMRGGVPVLANYSDHALQPAWVQKTLNRVAEMKKVHNETNYLENYWNFVQENVYFPIPVAKSISISGEAQAIGASEMTPFGVLIIYGGKDPKIKTYASGSLGIGWLGVSGTINETNYFYLGKNFREIESTDFEKWNNIDINFSIGEGIIGGAGMTITKLKDNRGFLIGITRSVGIGLGSPVSGSLRKTNTKYYNNGK